MERDSNMDLDEEEYHQQQHHQQSASSLAQRDSAWEARRRRKVKGGVGGSSSSMGLGENSGSSTSVRRSASNSGRGTRRSVSNSRRKIKEALPDDEYDPYDSDPGESYREHCERIKGESTRSCLAMPRFLKQLNHSVANNMLLENGGQHHYHHGGSGGRAPPTVATSPPSPLLSELDDGSPLHGSTPTSLFGGVDAGSLPASLPRDLARVRYSLRTSIGDGSQPQPSTSATLMERRELRPNNVHINVSHWSDFGGRNYMEDRCVDCI